MKKILLLLALLAPALLFAGKVDSIPPAEAAKLVAAGRAVLVDVREPSEWAETGVAAPAALLPKSEFDAGQIGDKEIILYCRSGRRAEVVGAELAKAGHRVANAGGFKDWQDAGLPVRPGVPGKK